jgi:hypothetical protein
MRHVRGNLTVKLLIRPATPAGPAPDGSERTSPRKGITPVRARVTPTAAVTSPASPNRLDHPHSQGKYRALRGLGARWTRILWRCWTDHTPYDPAIHHKTLNQPTA